MKKKFFSIFSPQTHLQSKKLNFLLKLCVKIYFAGIFSVRTQLWEKKDPDPYLRLMDPDPEPEGPKTCRSSQSLEYSRVFTGRMTSLSFPCTFVTLKGIRYTVLHYFWSVPTSIRPFRKMQFSFGKQIWLPELSVADPRHFGTDPDPRIHTSV